MDRLAAEAVSLATTSGMLMSKTGDANVHHTPFTLVPSPVRSAEFSLAVKLGTILNKVTMRLSGDYDYLRSILSDTAAADKEFTGRLVALLDGVRPPHTGIEFTINRYDFFVDASDSPDAPASARGLRMVEMNCIAAGGVTQAGLMTNLHKTLAGHPTAASADLHIDPRSMPENDSLSNSADSIAIAHEEFCNMYAKDSWPSVRIVMVVIPPFCNACDQDMLRWQVWQKHKIDFLRLTLSDINDFGSIREDGTLYISGFAGISSFVISVAYFRTGYTPYEYPTEAEWAGRALLERSNVVCCPSVAMQLVGTKKVQQVLCMPGVLDRFCDSEHDLKLIRSCFVRQLPLPVGEQGDKAAKMALENPNAYVLKPQREGGGNNLYKQEIVDRLSKLSPKERAGYVLMQRIYPASVKSILVRDGKWKEGNVVCELGIFGCMIRVKGKEVQNRVAGHNMKSKLSDIDDGGIFVGVAVRDSPRLI